ncbi:MAG: glucodextranase DOMON-like domain-containing protein [Candidatus Omnitrophota bacterium]
MARKPVFYLALASFFLLCSHAEAADRYGPFSGHSIKVDGSLADWVGVAPSSPNTGAISGGEFIWKDASGDDTGNGSYTYPKNAAFARAADLEEFRVTWDKKNVYFLVKTAMPGEWWAPYRVIAIDTDGAGGGGKGMQVIQQGYINAESADSGTFGELKVDDATAANYVIAIAGTYKGRIWDEKGNLIAKAAGESTDTRGFKIKDANACAIEIQVPQKIIGDPAGKIWRFIVACGLEDKERAREVYKVADEWHGGGGESTTAEDGVDPDFYDLAGLEKTTQETELSSYGSNKAPGDPSGFAEIKRSYLQVKFAPYPNAKNPK